MSVGVTGKGKHGDEKVALYDTVTGWAFGPTFHSEGDARRFLSFAKTECDKDVRALSPNALQHLVARWVRSGTP